MFGKLTCNKLENVHCQYEIRIFPSCCEFSQRIRLVTRTYWNWKYFTKDSIKNRLPNWQEIPLMERILYQLISSSSHYLQGFCTSQVVGRISFINSSINTPPFCWAIFFQQPRSQSLGFSVGPPTIYCHDIFSSCTPTKLLRWRKINCRFIHGKSLAILSMVQKSKTTTERM